MAMTCPSCQQPLPEPPPRFCPTCGYDTLMPGAPVEPDVAAGGAWPPPPPPALPPPLPPEGGGGAGGGTPWERRQQVGFASAFVETTQQVLFGPTAFFRAMPVTGGITGPLLYGVLAGYVGLVASSLYRFVLSTTMGMGWAGRGELDRYMPMLSSGFGLVMQLLFGPVLIAVGLFIVAAVMHLCLMVVGGAGGGFEATFRVVAYAEAAMLFSIIPLCGDVIGFIYWLVLVILGFSQAHRISGARATVAALLPFVVLCCCCGGLAAVAGLTGGMLAGLGNAR